MNKINLILKKAELFEKAAVSGRKKDFLKAIGQKSKEPFQESYELFNPSEDEIDYGLGYTSNVNLFNRDWQQKPNDDTVIEFEEENIQGKPSKQFPNLSRLNSKESVKDFQQKMLSYVKSDPNFNKILTEALGGKAWSASDVDGKIGFRTTTAWNLYNKYAKSSDPRVDISKKHEEITSVGAKLLNEFRKKLRTLRQQIATNTNNFQNRHNIGSDKVKAAWLPFLQKEYGQLSARYNQFPPEMKKEFTNLDQYMQSLFGAYMKAPPAEPRSLIDIDSYVYTPDGI